MNIKDCKGCYSEQYMDTTSKNHTVCGVLYKGKLKVIFMCPCVECLIKMMCEKACQSYKDYVQKVNKDIHFLTGL